MGEETKIVDPKGTQAKDDPKTVSLEDFTKLQESLESVKKAQAGSDAKVAELQKEKAEKEVELEKVKLDAENAKLSDADKLKNQVAALETKIADGQKATAHEHFLTTGYKEAVARGLSTTLVDNYGGKPEGLVKYLDDIKTGIDTKVTEKVTAQLLDKGYKPKGGNEQTSTEKWDHSQHNYKDNLAHDIEVQDKYAEDAAK